MFMDYKKCFKEFCEKENLDIKLSSKMPSGYEEAFGTFDVLENTLFFNEEKAKDMPEYEVLFYLFHELRHACQYIHPEKFSEEIQKSRFYVILYNGICYRLCEKEWKECIVKESEEYLQSLYINLPYEKDANTSAYIETRKICGDSEQLKKLYSYWVPCCSFGIGDYKKIFDYIDKNCI